MSPIPKLSVVMPMYNAHRFLAAAIDSILQQTFTDFEFILIDDCSTDNSVAIAESYSDARIKLYRNEENLGISRTLNKGIELAAAPLIARMDADDISYPERLQVQYAYLQAHPTCAMVSAAARVISEAGDFIRIDNFDSRFLYYNLNFVCWVYHPTVVYRKQAVQQVGMYTVPYAEDFDLFWQLSRRFVITSLPQVLLDYRVSEQSLHQVLKKKEYDLAQQAQVLRNIRYYTEPDFFLSSAQIQCLEHVFEPLLAAQDVGSIVECIKKLDYISQCIAQKENPNLNTQDVLKAAGHKRWFIISFYIANLPPHKGLWLALRLKLFRLIASKVKRSIYPASALSKSKKAPLN
jgi:glycosyltransferase involved in cell wall biosynthesis